MSRDPESWRLPVVRCSPEWAHRRGKRTPSRRAGKARTRRVLELTAEAGRGGLGQETFPNAGPNERRLVGSGSIDSWAAERQTLEMVALLILLIVGLLILASVLRLIWSVSRGNIQIE